MYARPFSGRKQEVVAVLRVTGWPKRERARVAYRAFQISCPFVVNLVLLSSLAVAEPEQEFGRFEGTVGPANPVTLLLQTCLGEGEPPVLEASYYYHRTRIPHHPELESPGMISRSLADLSLSDIGRGMAHTSFVKRREPLWVHAGLT